ncbi:MAG: hypothetical protein L0Y76_11130, partial [Ignavibacteria bacterium]|nr:hypothetical protein [Ignavibacteria bacterium]
WSWIIRINPYFWGTFTHDLITEEDDYFYTFCLRFSLTKNAELRLDYRNISEFWAGKQLTGKYFFTSGRAQWTKWFHTCFNLTIGDQFYYDNINPSVGDGISFYFHTQIQPDDKFTESISYQYESLDSKLDGSNFYNVSIITSKTTYQFDQYFNFRALIQWDSYRKVILSDLLLSYQLNPQTVVYLGYGSLHENVTWDATDKWVAADSLSDYYQTKQNIFFKVSYLFQL